MGKGLHNHVYVVCIVHYVHSHFAGKVFISCRNTIVHRVAVQLLYRFWSELRIQCHFYIFQRVVHDLIVVGKAIELFGFGVQEYMVVFLHRMEVHGCIFGSSLFVRMGIAPILVNRRHKPNTHIRSCD